MVKTTLKIDGMMCSMCEAHINDTIRKACPTAKKVTSSHKKGESVFLIDGKIDGEALKNAITETGYEFRGFKAEPYLKKGLFKR